MNHYVNHVNALGRSFNPTHHLFQSAPLTEARGDQQPKDGWVCFHCVSIRSPHRSKGRSATKGRMGLLPLRFNPLPSPKQGEMRRQFDQRQFDRVSIRSPHRSKGRFTMVLGPPERGLKFQSAPLTEARGDTSRSTLIAISTTRFNPLPSPKQGEISTCRE